MGRIMTITGLLLFLPLAATADRLAGLRRAFPALEQQLAVSLGPGMDRTRILSLFAGYYNPADPELTQGIRMVLTGDAASPNHALFLVAHQLAAGQYAPGDTITLALALVNNRLYAEGDEQVRRAIREDVLAHYAFYRRLVAWQRRRFEHAVDLSRMPLLPKLYWADRLVQPPEGIRYRIRNLEDYREYVDTIGTLEYFHSLAERHRLWEGITIRSIARGIYTFTHKKDATGKRRHLYNPNGEIMRRIFARFPHDPGTTADYERRTLIYRKKRCGINGFFWLNFQRRLYENIGQSVGLCEVSSLLEMAMLKAVGLPATTMVRWAAKELRTTGHAFALYYDPFRRRWNNLDVIRRTSLPYLIEIAIHKTRWHHRLPALPERIREAHPGPRLVRILRHGFQAAHLEAAFAHPRVWATNLLFSPAALPDDARDSDGDSFYDFEEKLLGLDPGRPDTARDGVSDLWKLHRGLDPLKPLAARDLPLPPVDGMGGGVDRARLASLNFPAPPPGPQTAAAPHLKTLAAGRFGNHLFISAAFHNDLRTLRRRAHTFTITVKQGSGKLDRFTVRVTKDSAAPDRNAALRLPDRFRELRGAALLEAEFLIPLRYLEGARTIGIRYHGGRTTRTELVLRLVPGD